MAGLALLAACGGGGGEPERLVVTLEYPVDLATAEIRQPLRVAPVLTGLNGHRPHCSLGAGSLPPGVSLADDCSISGTPGRGGNYSFTVHLTADGVTGSLDFASAISVLDPTPVLATVRSAKGIEIVGEDIDQSIPVGDSVYRQPLASITRMLDPGETLRYSLEGRLPTGLSFDPERGEINGTVTQTGQFDLRVGARLVRRGETFDAASVPVRLYISPLVATYGWSGCGLSWDGSATVAWLSPVSCTLSVQGLQPGDHWALGNVVTAGDARYDPASHVLSVAAVPTGGSGMGADLMVTLADGRQYSLGVSVTLWVRAPMPDWDDGSGLFANLAGVLRGPGQEPQVGDTSATARVQAQQAIALDPVGVTESVPGDTQHYALANAPGQAVPTWLSINAATGRLSGTPPALAPGQYQDVVVRLTTTRGGQQISADYTWRFYGPP